MSNKKYFWLKLKDDFFKTKDIRKLRMVAGGDTFTIIYLKMQLLSIRNEGIIEFIGIEDSIEEQLALELDEKIDDVKLTLAFLFHNRMIEQLSEEEYLLNAVVESIGSETTSAERMRRLREKRSNSVTMLPDVQESYTEIDIDIEIEKEIELDKEKENKPKKVDDTPYQEIVDLYHSITKDRLPKVTVITDKRKTLTKRIWSETGKDINVFKIIFDNLMADDFLSGKNGKWTKCNYDWLVTFDNAIKLYERGEIKSGTTEREPTINWSDLTDEEREAINREYEEKYGERDRERQRKFEEHIAQAERRERERQDNKSDVWDSGLPY